MIKQQKYVNPNTINTFFYIYFIVMPFLFITNKMEYINAFLVATIGYIAFVIGYKIKMGNNVILKNNFRETKLKKIIFYAFVISDIIKIITLISGGIDQKAYNIAYLESGGSNALYMTIITQSIVFIKYYIYSGYLKDNKKRFYIIFIISICATLSSRVRFDIIRYAIFFGVYGVMFKYIKLNWIKVLSGLVISPFLMLVFLIKRDIVGNLSFQQVINSIQVTFNNFVEDADVLEKIKMSMESFYTFGIYNNVITDRFIHPISGIFRVVFNFIPRSIWSEKPYPLQIILAREYNPAAYYSGGGIFANIYGDAYANGGILAVIIILFCLGVIAQKLYKACIINTENRELNVGLYCVFLIFLTLFYRGYLSDMTWQFILFVCIFKFLNYIEIIKIEF